jgi:hypothetical protein
MYVILREKRKEKREKRKEKREKRKEKREKMWYVRIYIC